MHRTEQNTLMAQVRTLSIKNEIKLFFIVFMCIFFNYCFSFHSQCWCICALDHYQHFFQSFNLGQLSYISVLDRLL